MNVPGVRMIDVVEGILGIEWIEGKSVRRLLPGGTEEEEEALDEIHDDTENEEDPLKAFDVSVGKYRFNASRLAFQFQLRFSRSNDDLDRYRDR